MTRRLVSIGVAAATLALCIALAGLYYSRNDRAATATQTIVPRRVTDRDILLLRLRSGALIGNLNNLTTTKRDDGLTVIDIDDDGKPDAISITGEPIAFIPKPAHFFSSPLALTIVTAIASIVSAIVGGLFTRASERRKAAPQRRGRRSAGTPST